MKIRLHLLGLMAVLSVAAPVAMAQAMVDSISGIRAGADRDYVLEGNVVTVWDDSFLLNDGSGQIVVDVRPYNTHDLGLSGQDYVMVSGHPVDGKLQPLVISRAGHEPVMFSGSVMLEPLPMDEVMRNTSRYRIRQLPAPDTSGEVAAPASAPAAAVAPATPPSAAPVAR